MALEVNLSASRAGNADADADRHCKHRTRTMSSIDDVGAKPASESMRTILRFAPGFPH
jgi:hypothetical protein